MIASGSLAVALLGYLYGSAGALFSALVVIGVLVIGGQRTLHRSPRSCIRSTCAVPESAGSLPLDDWDQSWDLS